MKNLNEYINEALMINEAQTDLWSLPAKDKAEFITFLDKTFNELKQKGIFSLNNKTDIAKVYKEFQHQSGADNSTFMMDKIAKCGFKDAQSFAKFIINSHDELVKYKLNIDWVYQWNETEAEKKYKEWKNSADYSEEISDDEGDERDLIIYDRWNPAEHAKYSFKGKRGKSTDHQINMRKMQFSKDHGVKYYDCYPILASNYYGHEEELKKRAEYQLGFDDPNEFK
jgi:hypothetical protein